MKTLFTKFMALTCLVVVVLSSCKKDEVRTVAVAGTPGTLTLSTNTPALTKANLNATALTVTGAPQTYGYNAVVTYTLQLAVKGTNFAAPTEVTLSAPGLTKSYTVKELNDLLLAMKLPVNVSAQLEVRLKSSLSSTAGITYSNVGTITATPFPLTSFIYVVGAFQDWKEKTPDSLISPLGDGVYTGIINFPALKNEFLILPAKSFSNKYATTATAAPTATIAYNGPNNLKAPEVPGQYYITLDLNANTITFALANTYSIIGTTTPGGNFSTDLDLTKFVNDGVTGWTGTVTMTAGAFKFRQNHDWTYSWGSPKSFNGKDITSDNGGDIPLAAAGTYNVSFNIPASVAVKSFVPVVNASYTAVKL